MTIVVSQIVDVAADPREGRNFDGGGTMSLRRWSSPIWLMLVLLAACAAAAQQRSAPWHPTVEVVNGSHAQVRIIVMVDGDAKDLGLVAVDTQVRLALPEEVVGAVVQFAVASPDGSTRGYLQPVFRFRPGMEFRLRLLPEDVPLAVRTSEA